MMRKKISPWIWVPTIVVALMLGLFISKCQQISDQNEAMKGKLWLKENQVAWNEFKASDPSYIRLHMTRSTAGSISVWGKTDDPDANKRIRSFIDSLDNPPVEVGVGVAVVSEEEWNLLEELRKEREDSGGGN